MAETQGCECSPSTSRAVVLVSFQLSEKEALLVYSFVEIKEWRSLRNSGGVLGESVVFSKILVSL